MTRIDRGHLDPASTPATGARHAHPPGHLRIESQVEERSLQLGQVIGGGPTMLTGLGLVALSILLVLPVGQTVSLLAREDLAFALAVILLGLLMMITRRKAIPQVIGFLAMENGLFFAATSATYGMPMVVELGIALDILVAMLILGVFFFQIREQFDSLDLHHLESLRDDTLSRGRE